MPFLRLSGKKNITTVYCSVTMQGYTQICAPIRQCKATHSYTHRSDNARLHTDMCTDQTMQGYTQICAPIRQCKATHRYTHRSDYHKSLVDNVAISTSANLRCPWQLFCHTWHNECAFCYITSNITLILFVHKYIFTVYEIYPCKKLQ